MTVEGVDYTPEGIESIREELSKLRCDAMADWPAGIHATLILSHAIALLQRQIELSEEGPVVEALRGRIERAVATLDGFGHESFSFDDVWQLIGDVRADLEGAAHDR